MLREARREDIPAMHRIRLAVRENRLTSTVVTESDYVPFIEEHGRGWVAEEHGEIVGFAIGDARSGSIWALFIGPGHEGKGHGRRLHQAMVSWLWSQGLERLWLTTDSATRAQKFYQAAGWQQVDVTAGGEVRFELLRQSAEAHMQRDEEQIRQLVSTWMAATKAGDTETVLSLVSEDVVFLVAGRPAMRKSDFAVAAHAQSGAGAPQFDGVSEIQEIKILGDWAYMWSKLTVVVTPSDGGKSVTRAGHTLSILKKERGKWMLARDANMLAPVSQEGE